MPAVITSYQVVVAIHVMAAVAAFGVVFAYPILLTWVRRRHPAAMPALHDAQGAVDQYLVGPGMVVLLGAGVYLASKLDVWDRTWVSIPLLILLVLGGAFGMFFIPTERRLAQMAARDLENGELGAEYDATLGRLQAMQVAAAVLVLVAVFFMVVKP